MKTRSIIALIAVAVLAVVVSCVKDLEEMGIYDYTEYIGTVVEKSTMQPIEGVKVQVTDGTHIHVSTITDGQGKFVLKEINFEEVNNDYYLWIDGSQIDLPSKQEELKGLGRKLYDYKALVLYDKNDASLLPIVSTDDIIVQSGSAGTVGGNVTYGGGDREVIERGVCYATHQTPTIQDSKKTAGAGLGKFTCNLTGLNRNTTYYVRAYATNAVGTTYGQQKMLTTKDGAPSVTTYEPASVTVNSAACGGKVSDDGGFSITERGIYWSTSRDIMYGQIQTIQANANRLPMGSGTGEFAKMLTGLQGNTTYYFRAYAKNSYMISFGNVKEFTTLSGLPTVTTTTAMVNGTTVISGGNVTDDGGYPVTARGICYGRFPNPDITSTYSHTNDGSGLGYYTSSFNMEDEHGIYYIRAYATNTHGTVYGEQVTAVTNSYDTLPTFMFNGVNYKVAPDPLTRQDEFITWTAANSYCTNLTAYGFSDWRLPTYEELLVMYQLRQSIGGWYSPYMANNNNRIYPSYWSSTTCSQSVLRVFVMFDDGSYYCDSATYYNGYLVLPEQHFGVVAHVRPIRVDTVSTSSR